MHFKNLCNNSIIYRLINVLFNKNVKLTFILIFEIYNIKYLLSRISLLNTTL